ncbi:MAG: hypothetical protein ACYSUK_06550 [Planctomycetota bacterium]
MSLVRKQTALVGVISTPTSAVKISFVTPPQRTKATPRHRKSCPLVILSVVRQRRTKSNGSGMRIQLTIHYSPDPFPHLNFPLISDEEMVEW